MPEPLEQQEVSIAIPPHMLSEQQSNAQLFELNFDFLHSPVGVELRQHEPSVQQFIKLQLGQQIIERLAGRQLSLYSYHHEALITSSKLESAQHFEFKDKTTYLSGKGKIVTEDKQVFDISFEWQQAADFQLSQQGILRPSSSTQPCILQLSHFGQKLEQAQYLPNLPQGSCFLSFVQGAKHLQQDASSLFNQELEISMKQGVFAQLSLWFSDPQTLLKLSQTQVANLLLAPAANPFGYTHDITQALDPLKQSIVPIKEQSEFGFRHQIDLKV